MKSKSRSKYYHCNLLATKFVFPINKSFIIFDFVSKINRKNNINNNSNTNSKYRNN